MIPTDDQVLSALSADRWTPTEEVRKAVFGDARPGRRENELDVIRSRLRKLAKWGYVERLGDPCDIRGGALWRRVP